MLINSCCTCGCDADYARVYSSENYWSICYDGKGQNVFGKLLVEVRDCLAKEFKGLEDEENGEEEEEEHNGKKRASKKRKREKMEKGSKSEKKEKVATTEKKKELKGTYAK